jgi:hypothetical protein
MAAHRWHNQRSGFPFSFIDVSADSPHVSQGTAPRTTGRVIPSAMESQEVITFTVHWHWAWALLLQSTSSGQMQLKHLGQGQ